MLSPVSIADCWENGKVGDDGVSVSISDVLSAQLCRTIVCFKQLELCVGLSIEAVFSVGGVENRNALGFFKR